mgnify:CR=1 FL=1
MNKRVLSIAQMENLERLGINTSNASMCYVFSEESEWKLCINDNNWYEVSGKKVIPTFTLHDILEILPKEIYGNCLALELDYCYIEYYYIHYEETCSWKSIDFNIEEIMDGVYEMLLWVIEKGYLKTK